MIIGFDCMASRDLDLLLAMFLTPFHLVSVFLFGLLHRRQKHPDTGVEVLQQGQRCVAKIGGMRPLTAFLVALLVCTFVGPFVALLAGLQKNVPAMLFLWAMIALICMLVALKVRGDRDAGVGDLVLSPGERWLECWPLSVKPFQRVRVLYQEIAKVNVISESQSINSPIVCVVELHLKGGTQHRLCYFEEAHLAARFHGWLSKQVQENNEAMPTD